ncbi:MAG: class I SAM-dependent methyltransferase [Candidatus Aenigmatarchaeota archaeon]
MRVCSIFVNLKPEEYSSYKSEMKKEFGDDIEFFGAGSDSGALKKSAGRSNIIHLHLKDGKRAYLSLLLGLQMQRRLGITRPKIITTVYSDDDKKPNRLIFMLSDRASTVNSENVNWSRLAEQFKSMYAMVYEPPPHPDRIYLIPQQTERVAWLKKHANGKILEIGCSTGYIIEKVGGIVGLDIDRYRIKQAKKMRKNVDFVIADATAQPFRNNSFDTVIIPDTLEHVDFGKAKKIVKESLRVGRKVLITVPNAAKKNYDKTLVENPEHVWRPTPQLVENLCLNKPRIEYTKNEDFMLVTLTKD